MKHILVPTDFSDTAGNAVNFAVQTSKIFPAKITLLHSFEITSSFSTDYMGVNAEYNQSMLNDLRKELEKNKEDIKERDGVEADALLSVYGLDQAIISTADEKKADLVIMGTLGASGIKEKLWGSRTSSIIGKTTVPVIAVPHNYRWKKPRKILFATNQFEKDPKILNFIFEMANLYMANVQVTVFTDADDDKAAIYVENKDKLADYENFLRTNYNESTLTAVHLYGLEFEDTMHSYIKENDIDMLVMVTYQPNFWSRIFNPSKTKRMSYNTDIPLLAIPSKG